MAKYTPPADATVIENSGLVSVYRMADGRILFVDETYGTPFSALGKLQKRLFFLTLFMVLAGIPSFMVKDAPPALPWLFNGTLVALMAYLIIRYKQHTGIWGRWKKQLLLYYEPGSQQWFLSNNLRLSDSSTSALEVVNSAYYDIHRSPRPVSKSQSLRTEIYYLYLRTAKGTNHLLLRTATFKKARAVASLLEDEGMPQLVARGFTPPTRD